MALPGAGEKRNQEMAEPCEPDVPPGQLMCKPEQCSGFADSFEWRAFCECLNGSGEPILDCTPRNSKSAIATDTCYNRVTHEQRNISEEDCQRLRDQNRDWIWKACYCCCRDISQYVCESNVPPGTMKCDPEVCSSYRTSDAWRAFCECLDWQGKRIPDCLPKNYL